MKKSVTTNAGAAASAAASKRGRKIFHPITPLGWTDWLKIRGRHNYVERSGDTFIQESFACSLGSSPCVRRSCGSGDLPEAQKDEGRLHGKVVKKGGMLAAPRNTKKGGRVC